MTPKISIITPSFNQGQYIEETIDSVLSQGYDNLQYVIIDGGSTDNSTEIIKKYEAHLDYWISEADFGQSHAINKGLRIVDGEIFNWLNSDDYYAPGALSHVADVFVRQNCHIYSGNSMIFDSSGELKRSRGVDLYESLGKTIGRARIDQPETFWSLKVVKQLGELNQSLHYLMDRDWWIKYLFQHGQSKVFTDDHLIAHFRLHEDSKTVSQKRLFKEERDKYFMAIASLSSSQISEDNHPVSKDTHIKLDYNPPQKLAHESLVHYWILRGEEAYAAKNYRLLKHIIRELRADGVSTHTLSHLNNLKRRSALKTILMTLGLE